MVAAVARVELPDGVEAPALDTDPEVAAAAVAFARLRHDLERGLPDRQRLETKIEELRGRAAAKRSAADAIKARRLRGVDVLAMLPNCTCSTKMPRVSMVCLPTRSRS